MAEIVHLTHDSGDWSEYDVGADGTRVYISPSAGLNGTAEGIVFNYDGAPSTTEKTKDFTPGGSETVYRIGFYFNKNTLSLASGAYVYFFVTLAQDVGGQIVTLYFIESGGNILLEAEVIDDNSIAQTATSGIISAGENTAEVQLEKASSAVANDAILTLYINGSQVDQTTGLDVYLAFEDINQIYLDHGAFGTASGEIYIDEIILRDDSTPVFSADEGSYVIGTAIDKETDGDTAFLTVWRDNNLYLQRWDLPTLTKEDEITLGGASLTEVQNRTKVAYPYAGSATKLWVFGNMDMPAYLTGTVHLIQSTAGGASGSWTIAPDLSSWAAGDVLDSLFVTPDQDGLGTRQFSAVRRRTSTPPELWQGLNALSLVSALPFPTGSSVEYRGMHMGQNREIAIGTATQGTGANRVIAAPDPYTTWTDITNNYPSGTVEVLRYL